MDVIRRIMTDEEQCTRFGNLQTDWKIQLLSLLAPSPGHAVWKDWKCRFRLKLLGHITCTNPLLNILMLNLCILNFSILSINIHILNIGKLNIHMHYIQLYASHKHDNGITLVDGQASDWTRFLFKLLHFYWIKLTYLKGFAGSLPSEVREFSATD